MSLTVKQVKASKVRNSEFRTLGKSGMRSHGIPYHGTKYEILIERRFRIYSQILSTMFSSPFEKNYKEGLVSSN